ncbi:MAG: hypothetical protein WAT39_13880 [Planctomycetota bacterium]
MTHRTPSFLSLPLSLALLTIPAAAQVSADALPPAKPTIRLAMAGVDFAVALVALEDERIAFANGEVLNNAVVMLARDEGGERFVELPDLQLRLFWQSLTVDSTDGGLRIGAIQAIDKRRPKAAVHAALPGDLAVAGDAPDGRLTAVDADAPANAVKSDQAPTATDEKPADLPVCTWAGDDGFQADDQMPIVLTPVYTVDSHISDLYASFIAPTDGYGLGLVDVRGAQAYRSADVYLYRKLPGKGEGRLRAEEKLHLMVSLPKVAKLRVFLAEGTNSRPGNDTTWREIARLPR